MNLKIFYPYEDEISVFFRPDKKVVIDNRLIPFILEEYIRKTKQNLETFFILEGRKEKNEIVFDSVFSQNYFFKKMGEFIKTSSSFVEIKKIEEILNNNKSDNTFLYIHTHLPGLRINTYLSEPFLNTNKNLLYGVLGKPFSNFECIIYRKPEVSINSLNYVLTMQRIPKNDRKILMKVFDIIYPQESKKIKKLINLV